MADQISAQAKLFLYDLGNSAREHWFKADEAWEISLASGEEKAVLEKKYHPTLSAAYPAEILADMLRIVKGKLKIALFAAEERLNLAAIRLDHLQYLVAYNAGRPRT